MSVQGNDIAPLHRGNIKIPMVVKYRNEVGILVIVRMIDRVLTISLLRVVFKDLIAVV